jgi:O-antigen ligase
MRLHTVVAAYALWILAIVIVFYLVQGDNENALQLVVMCGAIPALCQIFLLGIDWRGLVAPVKLWLVFVLVVLLSYLLNGTDPRTAPTDIGQGVIPPAWTPIVFTLNAVFILAVGTLVAGSPDRRLVRSIGSLYCILTAPFLVYIILTGERVSGRLSAGLQFNMWGLVGLTVCLGALARKPGPLAIAAFAVGLSSILESSSRENLLCVVAALLVVTPLYLEGLSRGRLLAALAALCVTLFAAVLLLDPYILDAIQYFNRDILLLDSRERGINSGFTGRTDIWAETVGLWLKSPLLGIGFRQHERFLAGWPAHNAYLAMLADMGLVGLVVYLVLLISSLVAAWSIQDQRTRRFVVAVIVAYIVSGFMDRRTINAGNPFSVLFLMCSSLALVDQSLRRAAVLWRKSPAVAKGSPLEIGSSPSEAVPPRG